MRISDIASGLISMCVVFGVAGCGGSSSDQGATTVVAASGVGATGSGSTSGSAGTGGTAVTVASAHAASAQETVAHAAAPIDAVSSTGGADTVVAIVSPSGTIEADLHATAHVSVTFATNDGSTATELNLITKAASLPAGWSYASSTMPCARVNTGTTCSLMLDYAPTVAAPAGQFTLAYSYTNDAAQVELGYATIAYLPISHNAYVINNQHSTMSRCAVASSGDITSCSSVAAPLLSQAEQITLHGSNVYIADTSVVWICGLAPTGLTNCASFSGGLTGPEGIAFSGSNAYVVNSTGSISKCAVGTSGTLSACSTTTLAGTDNPHAIAVYGSTLLVANVGNNAITECTLDASGNPTNCTTADTSGLTNEPVGLTVLGSTLYVTNSQVVTAVLQCTFGSNGLLSGCADSGARGFTSGFGVTFIGNDAYVPTPYDNAIYRCSVASNGTLSHCANASSAISTFAYPIGILLF
ncbi:hypothetical protein [Pararobbsia silviterrae]|uniref:Uncharacterized protein n=1 Tax=Pararobbsia silviterrae TaxID=1792498 RepID=A0A494XZB7_9BURK|nr:hypothetical protein [Pararobbsia silviterrae]RKP55865.1 hypothetical protein D7S86_11695 [Pararobbsia silviterrae]